MDLEIIIPSQREKDNCMKLLMCRIYTITQMNLFTNRNRNFPGGPEVKNLPCNARDVSLIPSLGIKIPEQLSPSTATTEPTGHN